MLPRLATDVAPVSGLAERCCLQLHSTAFTALTSAPNCRRRPAQDELAACGLLFSQQKQAAPLAPQTGDAAFAAAAAVGPQAATVAGGPIVAGEYQQHHHAHPQQQQHLGSSGPGKAAPPPQGMQLGGEL